MKQLLLYSTSGCHLCEVALQLIQQNLDAGLYELAVVEISDSDQLVDQYGIRIPVVAHSDSCAELGWPFDESEFQSFLASL